MVMTILEAHVSADQWGILEKAYAQETQGALTPGIVQTYLAHSINDPGLWRILTVWRSREVLDEMRKQGTPRGVVMFREAGAEPVLSIFEVAGGAGA
jgi:heme-degrading monooxygenase HmoA